jgi:hypothetical protein
VYVPSMPLELLHPSELSLATGRFHGRFHFGAHPTVTVVSGILGSWISGSERLSLGHINMHSNHGKPDGAYLVGWKIVLRAQLDVKRQRSNRSHWESVVEIQR